MITMKDIQILVIEDEPRFQRLVEIYLKREGYLVDFATTGMDAIELFNNKTYDLILLDVMLPEVSGWTLCKKFRKKSSVPIIMLTAKATEEDCLLGFELGVDDYITKPFSPKELVARIKVIFRRHLIISDVLQVGPMKIYTKYHTITIDDTELELTPKEYELLAYFAVNSNMVLSREQILNYIWGVDYDGDIRTVDTHVKQLRGKLGTYKNFIYTIWGSGYKFKVCA